MRVSAPKKVLKYKNTLPLRNKIKAFTKPNPNKGE